MERFVLFAFFPCCFFVIFGPFWHFFPVMRPIVAFLVFLSFAGIWSVLGYRIPNSPFFLFVPGGGGVSIPVVPVAALVAHDCGYPLSRYTCRATRVAADFLDFIAFCRCSTGVALHPLKILVSDLPPPVAGGVAPKFGSEKVSRCTGMSQLQLRVSRYTVQRRWRRGMGKLQPPGPLFGRPTSSLLNKIWGGSIASGSGNLGGSGTSGKSGDLCSQNFTVREVPTL